MIHFIGYLSKALDNLNKIKENIWNMASGILSNAFTVMAIEGIFFWERNNVLQF